MAQGIERHLRRVVAEGEEGQRPPKQAEQAVRDAVQALAPDADEGKDAEEVILHRLQQLPLLMLVQLHFEDPAVNHVCLPNVRQRQHLEQNKYHYRELKKQADETFVGKAPCERLSGLTGLTAGARAVSLSGKHVLSSRARMHPRCTFG